MLIPNSELIPLPNKFKLCFSFCESLFVLYISSFVSFCRGGEGIPHISNII